MILLTNEVIKKQLQAAFSKTGLCNIHQICWNFGNHFWIAQNSGDTKEAEKQQHTEVQHLQTSGSKKAWTCKHMLPFSNS